MRGFWSREKNGTRTLADLIRGVQRSVNAAMEMDEKCGVQQVEEIQQAIPTAYSLDFTMHAPAKDIPRIAAIWNSIPSQLARENRKFVYKLIKTGAVPECIRPVGIQGLPVRRRIAPRYGSTSGRSTLDGESALHGNQRCNGREHGAAIPRSAFRCDAALLDLGRNRRSGFPAAKRHGTAARRGQIRDTLSGRSLSVYIDRFAPELALRYSMNNLKRDGGILNIPLFLSDWTKQLLKVAKE